MSEEEKTVKKWTKKRVIKTIMLLLIIIGLIVAACFYCYFVQYYTEHFYDGTTVNGIDCSDLTEDQAAVLLQDKINEWSITVHEREGATETIDAQQIEMTYENDGSLKDLYVMQQPLLWGIKIFDTKEYEVPSGFSYNEEILKSAFDNFQQVREFVPMKNAEIIQQEDGTYAISPEVVGTEMDQAKAYDALVEAIKKQQTELDLEEFYLSPEVFADDKDLVDEKDKKNAYFALTRADIHIQFGENEYIINEEMLKDWLVEDPTEKCKLDDNKLREFVQGLYDQYNAGHEGQLFKTRTGKVLTLTYFEADGWNMDVDKTCENYKNAILEGYQGSLGPVMSRLDEQGNERNDMYVEISIDDQTMWLWVNGEVQVETPIVSGGADEPFPEQVPTEQLIAEFNSRSTPTNGIWTIKKKESPHFMRGPQYSDGSYEYTLETTYWLPFNDQIGIHDNYERLLFGANIYMTSGSHGCVNTPYEKVEEIFNTVDVGTMVVVYGMDQGEDVFAPDRVVEEKMPMEFRHPMESYYNS